MQWFTFPISILAVAPGTSKSNQFTTDKNHAFATFWGSLEVRDSTLQNERNTDPAVYSMSDTSNLQYQPQATGVDIVLAWGNAKQPAIWPIPLLVKPNSGIILTVTNQHLANTNTYNFGFMGALISVPPGFAG
jgi:hypothetical protein